jgi:hypothetical protein
VLREVALVMAPPEGHVAVSMPTQFKLRKSIDMLFSSASRDM